MSSLSGVGLPISEDTAYGRLVGDVVLSVFRLEPQFQLPSRRSGVPLLRRGYGITVDLQPSAVGGPALLRDQRTVDTAAVAGVELHKQAAKAAPLLFLGQLL